MAATAITPTEKFDTWTADRVALSEDMPTRATESDRYEAPADPVEALEQRIYAKKGDASDIEIDRKEGDRLGRQLHKATEDYREELQRVNNDSEKVDPIIRDAYYRAEAAHVAYLNAADAAEVANEQRGEARDLIGTAIDQDAVYEKLIRQGIENRMEWEDSIFKRGEVREDKPPLILPADHFDITERELPLGDGVIDGARTRGGKAKQTVIFAPRALHKNIHRLMNDPAFWQGVDGRKTRQIMRGYDGEFGEFAARAQASTDAGAWAGTSEWGEYWELMGGETVFFDKSVFASTIDVDYTDPIPVGAVSGAPAGGWFGENEAITLDDMETLKVELEAFGYAVGTDISDKYLKNSWAMKLGFKDAVREEQIEKTAYDIGVQFVAGAGVADKTPAGLNATIGGVARNKIQQVVKHDDLKASDLIQVMYKVQRRYRRGGLGPNAASFIGHKDVWSALEAETSPDRRVNTEGNPWITSPITYPNMGTGFNAPAHLNYFLRSTACYESDGFEAPTANKTTALWYGCWKKGVIVRRSSLYSAFIPIAVMVGGQQKIQERLVHWIYVDIKQIQNATLSGEPGPVVVVQPNRA